LPLFNFKLDADANFPATSDGSEETLVFRCDSLEEITSVPSGFRSLVAPLLPCVPVLFIQASFMPTLRYRVFFTLLTAIGLPLASLAAESRAAEVHTTDVCVVGGTASGVMAAVAASREGSSVVLVEPSRWLGGMTGGGISNLDWGKREAVGGSTRTILEKGYNNAQFRQVFTQLCEKHQVHVIYEHRLGSVEKEGRSIVTISLDLAPPDDTGCPPAQPREVNVKQVRAKVFIDCTYEGDLMAASGVSYTFGRESTEKYGESLAGTQPPLWVYDIDPYNTPGNPESGLLPLLQHRQLGPVGSADPLTMGYCFRYKLDLSGQGIPIEPTADYDPAQFELFRRGFQKGEDLLRHKKMSQPGKFQVSGGNLYRRGSGNLNRSVLTTTVYGCNADYPDGDWAERARVWKFHQNYFRNLTHFLRTDPSVPPELRAQAEKVSFQQGLFDDTNGWPHQLYVREARRMVSSYVLTQADLAGQTDPKHSVGLASYGVDDWPYATLAQDGKVVLSGGAFSKLRLGGPHDGIYAIPYQAIVPQASECENVLVPVCCSASHIAMTSVRMEPVWMILGESAGVAAALAVQDGTSVQQVPYDQLQAKLIKLGQRLSPQGLAVTQQISTFLHTCDDNGNGTVSRSEWNRHKQGWQWAFDVADQNQDGTLTPEEYRAFQQFKRKNPNWADDAR